MNVLLLCHGEEPLREIEIGEHPLELGRGFGCDVVVHDPDLPERHLLVQRQGEALVVHLLAESSSERAPLELRPNEPLPLGSQHSLVWVPDAPSRPRSLGQTEPLSAKAPPGGRASSVVVGRGASAVRARLSARPLSVGSGEGNDLVVEDRSVSGRHCRIEPCAGGVRIRDLGSRNGTFVDGVRVDVAWWPAGSVVRVGRTDLRLVFGGGARGPTAPIVAESSAMTETLGQVQRFARYSYPALLIGESGTGKELLARTLHDEGPTPQGPFVAINAGGLPASLLESELFGHERGSFTGATAAHRGVFEQAEGGTLFLDEIGELPSTMQARLLRVLETWQVRRVGSEQATDVHLRLVCATHRDLRQMVSDGTFRQDLYFRLARLIVEVPPLRSRPADIAPLAQRFLAAARDELGARVLSPEALHHLERYHWPGNARELRNVVVLAATLGAGASIEVRDIERAMARVSGVPMSDPDEVESLEALVARHRGNLAAAARELGIPRTTLRDRLRAAERVGGVRPRWAASA